MKRLVRWLFVFQENRRLMGLLREAENINRVLNATLLQRGRRWHESVTRQRRVNAQMRLLLVEARTRSYRCEPVASEN